MVHNKFLIFLFIGFFSIGLTATFLIHKAHAAPLTFYVNPNTGNDLWDGTTATFVSGTTGPVQTIDQAITLAASGDTIILAAADYSNIGEIAVNKSLTIRSFAGTYTSNKKTIIKGNSDFFITADDVSIVGIIFEAITALNAGVTIGAADNDIVRDCRFSHTVASAILVSGSTNSLISNNLFNDLSSAVLTAGIDMNLVTNAQIIGNTFMNIDDVAIIDSSGNNLLVEDNIFNHIADGGISLSGTDGATINANTMTGCNYADGVSAIDLAASTLLGSIDIVSNSINNTYRNGSGTAIGTDSTDIGAATITIYDNDLSGNVWGINHLGIGAIDAENNWWGSSTGPYEAVRNSHGLGVSIVTNPAVDFDPYYLSNYWVKSSTVTGNISMIVYKDKLFQARRDRYSHLYTRYSANGDSWSSWSYGGHAYDIAMAVSGTALYQAIKGSGGYYYRRYTTNGTTWSNWSKSGTTIGRLTMWSYNGNLYQTKIVTGNKAYMRINNGSWSYLGTSMSNIESVNLFPGIIQSRIASNNYIYYRTAVDGVTWSPWIKEGGTAKNITMVIFDDGGGDSVYETKVGLDNYFYTRVFAAAWVRSGSASGKPSMTALDDKLYQSKRVGSTNYIRYSFDGATWNGWQVDHTASGDETMTGFSDELYRAMRGTNGYIYTTHM